MSVPRSPARPSRRSPARGAAGWPGRVGCLLVALAGCSVGDYDKRYEEATKAYRLMSLFDPQDAFLADNRVAYRIARVFKEDDTQGNAPWSKPSFLRDFPGFRVAYRGQATAGDAAMPVTLSIGVLTDDASDVEKVKRDISAALREDAAFAKAAWEEGADLGGLKGQDGRLPWSRLKLAGKQPFEITVAGNPEQKNIEGATEVWVSGHPDNKVAVVFVWRAPAEVLEQVKFDEIVRFTAAKVLMNPLADAPAAADPAPADAAAPAAAPAAAAGK